jgi:hypothetical protein
MAQDTREEKLKWCKERALAYLAQGLPRNAINSLANDFQKTELYPQSVVVDTLIFDAMVRPSLVTVEFINGFN